MLLSLLELATGTERIDLPSCIRSKAWLISVQPHRVGDEGCELDLAAIASSTMPGSWLRPLTPPNAVPIHPAGDQLERPRRDLLTRRRPRR
jgi:hypothetical protein